MEWQLAELNVGRLRAPVGDPLVAEFVGALDMINSLAEGSDGFVWRLQSDDGDATAFRISPDERVIVNLSVWTSVEALGEFVYRSGHVEFLRRRREWFEAYGHADVVLWWVPAGHRPDLVEAVARLDQLDAFGAGTEAFTFRQRFGPPGAAVATVADERDTCPA